MILEVTQEEYEAMEARLIAARERFLMELSRHPELSRLYSEFRELEHRGIEVRRARREAEIQEAG